jgi:excisionase family DNA binding protein
MSDLQHSDVEPIERRALRVNDCAKAYGIGRSTIYKLMNEGKLATAKIAGRRVVLRDSAEALLRAQSA